MGLQAFIVYKCVTRFLTYISLPWPQVRAASNFKSDYFSKIASTFENQHQHNVNAQEQQPYLELNLYVGLVGAGVVLLPFFFISFMFKVEKIILIVENILKS